MKNKTLYLLSIFLSFNLSCDRPVKEHYTILKNNEFNVINTTKLEQHGIKLSDPLELLLYDSILIASNLSDSLLISAYNLNTNEKIASLIERGGDKNQLLSLTSLTLVDDNTLFGFDAILQKAIKFDLNSAISKSRFLPFEEILLSPATKGTREFGLFNDSTLIGTSYFIDDSRLFTVNNKSEITSKIGYLPFQIKNKNGVGKLSVKALFNASNLEYNKDKKIAFLPYKNSERIDIYRDTSLYKILVGEKYREPDFDVQKTRAGYTLESNKNTTYYYVNSYSTKNYIYCIYSGTKKSIGKELHIFDWQGSPKWKILLNRNFASVVAWEKEKQVEIFLADVNGLLYKFILNR
ncbi:TolB-like 6-bladed beta-propeller domain-containing protein [Sphingobacterium sp. PCS056]|uniref:BF3164 family lipoprotein n=1 Tax=Sphingobacterium sp. PCS056 TaxID=2931400 RepID=UPI00200BA66B|nr:BF3164 family lipoprotein [Sphingobacterium sp. PCS056]UPZ37499.1 TolB-like 6-bladed beta-propeller domain-containing protein [Sphingobacterium sp. PCS056]